MPRRSRSTPKIDDLVGSAAEVAVGTLFDRATSFLEGMRDRQASTLPAEQLGGSFVCAACRRELPFDGMEMVNPGTQFGCCRQCFGFMWGAAEEKLQVMARARAEAAAKAAAEAVTARAAQQAQQQHYHQYTQGARAPGPAAPARRKPWEILGIDADASIEEVKKAYRIKASEYHPDTVPPGAPAEEREAARAKFEECTRAKDAMLKVRQVAT
jgi:pyruvate/2-oxoglutarate dehydrogenase complex dihydrolipoamide acyltransferase (E2) component